MRLQNTMVYADPRNDITDDVVFNLNRVYETAHGAAPKAANGTPAAGQSASPAQADGRWLRGPDCSRPLNSSLFQQLRAGSRAVGSARGRRHWWFNAA